MGEGGCVRKSSGYGDHAEAVRQLLGELTKRVSEKTSQKWRARVSGQDRTLSHGI